MTRHRINLTTTGNARALRSNLTDAEQMLWRAIRGKQLCDVRFRRQHPVGKYIADFACPDRMLIVELDGGQHQEQVVYDEARTGFLQAQGWTVLRFWNSEVLENLEGVLAVICETLSSPPPSQPSPLQGEGVSSTD
jgi:very-short-patch-repair endonuclease